jgi:FkbM family methyltransferase
MKEVGNFFVQDDDTFFQMQYDRKFPMDGELHQAILDTVPYGGNALDIGAHVGIWSRQLVKKFDTVYAWEPIGSNSECLRYNVPNVVIIPFAAATKKGIGAMKTDVVGNYGGYCLSSHAPLASHQWSDSDRVVKTQVIDDHQFKNISFVQLHVKGGEYEALLGCEKTLEQYHPTIVYQAYEHQLRIFKHTVHDIETFLTNLGYTIELNNTFAQWDITYYIAR